MFGLSVLRGFVDKETAAIGAWRDARRARSYEVPNNPPVSKAEGAGNKPLTPTVPRGEPESGLLLWRGEAVEVGSSEESSSLPKRLQADHARTGEEHNKRCQTDLWHMSGRRCISDSIFLIDETSEATLRHRGSLWELAEWRSSLSARSGEVRITPESDRGRCLRLLLFLCYQ